MRCETKGSAGNAESGMLIPIDYIDGLTLAQISDVLIPGEDEESTEHLRQRYFNSLNSKAFGGNVQDYKEKTLEIDGVGGVKVYRVWNGGGTVKLVIVDSQFKKPSELLINSVQSLIDPVQNQGKGTGIAPIGHIVTVVGVKETRVDITTSITFQSGWIWEDIKPYAEQAIDGYLTELSQSWADEENLVVRISQVETRLLNLAGVVDITNTFLNGEAQNLTIEPDNIPVKGDVING